MLSKVLSEQTGGGRGLERGVDWNSIFSARTQNNSNPATQAICCQSRLLTSLAALQNMKSEQVSAS